MPIFEYECQACGQWHEVLLAPGKRDPRKCPQVRQAEAVAEALHVCERAGQGGHMLAEVGVSGSALGPRAGSSHQASNDLTARSVVVICGK